MTIGVVFAGEGDVGGPDFAHRRLGVDPEHFVVTHIHDRRGATTAPLISIMIPSQVGTTLRTEPEQESKDG